MEFISLQEGYKKGRKRGWCKCEDCGMILAFQDKEIIESHIKGTGCQRDRQFFGLGKKEQFNDGKTRKLNVRL